MLSNYLNVTTSSLGLVFWLLLAFNLITSNAIEVLKAALEDGSLITVRNSYFSASIFYNKSLL